MGSNQFNSGAWYKQMMIRRVKAAIAEKDAGFAADHAADSLEELSQYLRDCRIELGHAPDMQEIVGGAFLAERFDGWQNALESIGEVACHKTPNFMERKIVKEEFILQKALYRQEADAKKLHKQQCCRGRAEKHKNGGKRMVQEYAKIAERLGFTHCVLLEDLSLVCKPELRAYCNPSQCPNHGKNWVCPPACGTLAECQRKVDCFHRGLLLQSVTELIPPTSQEVYGELNRAHNLRLKELVEAVRPEAQSLLPLTSGGCIFCDTCRYPEPCVHPDVKMESLSAFGIDVTELCDAANLPYSFREDRVYLTALLLF